MFKVFLGLIATLVLVSNSLAQTKPRVVVIPLGSEPMKSEPVAPTIPGFILGRSSQTSNGRFTFNGVSGMAAASEMCKATYTEEPTAHLCNHSEIQNALANGQYDQDNTDSINNTFTWTTAISGATNGSYVGSRANSCWNFSYNSGDVATGTRLSISLNTQSPGNGGGVFADQYDIRSNVACNNNQAVMCCR